jgi:hypothetical protein
MQFLAGYEFPDREALLEAVRPILEGIQKGTLDRVFPAWMKRFERNITTNGEYTDQRTI